MNELKCQFRQGQLVRVKCGTLEGLTGRVRSSDDLDRSLLLLDSLPTGILVALDNTVLEAVGADAPDRVH